MYRVDRAPLGGPSFGAVSVSWDGAGNSRRVRRAGRATPWPERDVPADGKYDVLIWKAGSAGLAHMTVADHLVPGRGESADGRVC